MTYAYSTFALPLDTARTFSVAVDENGALVATAFGDLRELQRRLLFASFRESAPATEHVRAELLGYAQGSRRDFTLRLAPVGSEYQQRVWAALQHIPYGVTRTYGQLALELQSSPRAVGRANATNPICLVVPCHRVIGADGSLTGFAFGEEVKAALLQHEARNLRPSTEPGAGFVARAQLAASV